MATAEFCKFAGILSAALSQHHPLGISSTGILLSPLALFVLMLPKAHLTLHSRMSGSAAAAAAAAAAAKSLQSCPTLCDPRDGSPPGSPIPGILQARTLEWVAISFSNA